MKEYVLKRVEGQPDWNQIPVMQIDYQKQEVNHGITAQAQLCWSDVGIHVHLSCQEKHIRKELTGKLDPIWEDSCLEFFLRPTEDLHYFNFEFNPNCALFLGYSKGKPNIVRLLVPGYMEKMFAPVSNLTDDGWEITYTVPFEFIQNFFPDFQPKSGTKFYGNCYKCGDETVVPHFLMWNPLPMECSFHSPEHFGRLILE